MGDSKDVISTDTLEGIVEGGKVVKKTIGDIATSGPILLANLSKSFGGVTGEMKALGISTIDLKKVMTGFFGSGSSGIKNLGKAFIGALAPVRSALLRDLIDPTKSASDSVAHMGKDVTALNGILKKLITTQDIARTAIMTTSDGAGTFAERMKKATNIAEEYPASLHRSAASTGFFTTELLTFDKASRMIPGAFDGVKVSVRDFGGVLAGATLTSTQMTAVALRALGFQASEQTAQFGKLYTEFGQFGKSAVKSMAEVNQARKGTGVQAKLAYEQISQASQVFGIFGGKVSSAAETWRDFNMALRDSVPVGEINKMVSTATRGITSMTLQHRAFIAQVSGAQPGSGMLGGALKMEMALRTPEGMGKNMDALTQTLSQFAGGKIITLEQAVEMPELETQFVLQRQLLGQLAGVTGNEQQNRMLEVLSSVQSGGASRLDASKEVGDLMKGGVSLQQQSVTFLEKIAQSTRQFTHVFNGYLNRLNTPLSKGIGKISSRAAQTTKGREIPMIPKLGIGNVVRDTFNEMKRDNPKWEIPGGLPTREELGAGSGTGGGTSTENYTIPGTPKFRGTRAPEYFNDLSSSIKAQRRQTYQGSPSGFSPKEIPAETRATAIDSSLLLLKKLESALLDNTKVIKEEMDSTIKMELTSSCPDCNQSKMEKLMGERGGVFRGANV